ncbi:MAG TPA: hypothetical protein H9899_02210 [Candidatus Sphingomonas excrementigallinarum]|nr:hypothetical protein [Candidatus Sphingomonas excrementigallinarum]
MIDSFALLLSHGLMLVAAWRLFGRRELDQEGDAAPGPMTSPITSRTRSGIGRRRDDA